MPITRVPSPSLYAPKIGFCAATSVAGWIHTAGMTAVNGAGEVVGGSDPEAQATEVLRKLLGALAEAGAGPEHVVKTQIMVTDAAHAEGVGKAHGAVFADHRPAATMIVTRLLDPRMLVEIEAVAFVG